MNETNHTAGNQFLIHITPEIGNALGGVLSATQALLNGAENDPAFRRDLLGDMEANLHYLSFMLDNWILYTAIRSGKFNLVRRQVDLQEWLGTLLDSWPKRPYGKRLRWDIRLGQDLPTVLLDLGLVEQALENLRYASVLSAPAGTAIRISAGYLPRERAIWIEISDAGPWLADDILPRLIASPDRIRWAHPRLQHGSHLGLGIAHAIALAHGGRLASYAGHEHASRFRLTLPAGA